MRVLAAVLALNASVLQAADWPRWLGPNQNGSTTAEGALGASDLKLRKAWRKLTGQAPVRAGLASCGTQPTPAANA